MLARGIYCYSDVFFLIDLSRFLIFCCKPDCGLLFNSIIILCYALMNGLFFLPTRINNDDR